MGSLAAISFSPLIEKWKNFPELLNDLLEVTQQAKGSVDG